MTNATRLTEELSNRKIPPEDDNIQQLVDEKIHRMNIEDQVGARSVGDGSLRVFAGKLSSVISSEGVDECFD